MSRCWLLVGHKKNVSGVQFVFAHVCPGSCPLWGGATTVVNLDGFRRWQLLIRKSVWSGRLNLRNVEDRVDKAKFMQKAKTNGVVTNAVDNLEWSKVRLSEFMGRSGRLDIFQQEEDLLAWSDDWRRNASFIRSSLIALLS